jgi:hypothetical protein
VLFTGDVVYVDRLLGVIPVSSTKQWLATFEVIEQLNPAVLVPGHGRVANLATAQADTQAYLLALRAHMKKAVDDGIDVSAAVRSFDAAPFMRLLNAAELMPGNASRTYPGTGTGVRGLQWDFRLRGTGCASSMNTIAPAGQVARVTGMLATPARVGEPRATTAADPALV